VAIAGAPSTRRAPFFPRSLAIPYAIASRLVSATRGAAVADASGMTNTGDFVFRNTASNKGRHISVAPHASAMRRLHYGRIILDASVPRAKFETSGREVGLICLSGACSVDVGGKTHDLAQYDSLYAPPGSLVEVRTEGRVDLVDFEAEVEGDYPVQLVRYSDIEREASLRFQAGGDGARRTLNVLIGGNVKAGRILGGFTRSAPGNWTSWPPHEHAAMLEELYVFFDMPPPAFGVQCVYTRGETPDFLGIVREGDAVCIPRGYHPNVAVPGSAINFVWLMAAHREGIDRKMGVVNVEPAFATGGSGLEAATRGK
jgi:5-deoxy-glucuronate isomerase